MNLDDLMVDLDTELKEEFKCKKCGKPKAGILIDGEPVGKGLCGCSKKKKKGSKK